MNYQNYRRVGGLFLMEPEGATLDALRRDPGFSYKSTDNLQDIRVEFTRLFTMSVYPYASVFIDDPAELSGESTTMAQLFYERVGFELKREWMLGAPDALGAELECVARLAETGRETEAREFLRNHLLPWGPVCCVAVERNARLDLYRSLAQLTRGMLLDGAEELEDLPEARGPYAMAEPEERDLHWLVDHLLTPARCGIFVSKQELIKTSDELQIPIGFGDRGLMAANLLKGAGAQERVAETLRALQRIVQEWREQFAEWVVAYPRSAMLWGNWLGRTDSTVNMLAEMQVTANEAFAEKA